MIRATRSGSHPSSESCSISAIECWWPRYAKQSTAELVGDHIRHTSWTRLLSQVRNRQCTCL
jgi:hypothetical protein